MCERLVEGARLLSFVLAHSFPNLPVSVAGALHEHFPSTMAAPGEKQFRTDRRSYQSLEAPPPPLSPPPPEESSEPLELESSLSLPEEEDDDEELPKV